MKYVLANSQKYGVHPAIKLSDTNVGEGDGFATYPLYAIAFLNPEPEEIIIPAVDLAGLKVPGQKE